MKTMRSAYLAVILLAMTLPASWMPAAAGACAGEVVSDERTIASGTFAPVPHAAVSIPAPWTGVWAGVPAGSSTPEFIWYESEARDPRLPTQGVFVRHVIGCSGGSGMLYVNGDNAYQAFWNGAHIALCAPSDPESKECFENYITVPISIRPGPNVLVIIVENFSCACANPAMAQFRVFGDVEPASAPSGCQGVLDPKVPEGCALAPRVLPRW